MQFIHLCWMMRRTLGSGSCRRRSLYRDAKLVLFRNAVSSGCGIAQSVTGPFYCPADRKVCIDLGFYDELKQRFGASGDFAQAYVLAIEVGHHVQNPPCINNQVRQAQRANPWVANELSVRLELQTDCLALVWAHSTKQRNLLERGDLDQALTAAAAIGDDRLQKMATGQVRPDLSRTAHPSNLRNGSSEVTTAATCLLVSLSLDDSPFNSRLADPRPRVCCGLTIRANRCSTSPRRYSY